MKKRFLLLFLLLLFSAHLSIVSAASIIINHTAVDDFNNIPQYYIDKIKSDRLVVSYLGGSHAREMHNGLKLLEAQDSRFSADVNSSPLLFLNNNATRDLTGKYTAQFNSWSDTGGANTYWLDDAARKILNDTIKQVNTNLGYPVKLSFFGWSYQMCSPTGFDLGHLFTDADLQLYLNTLYSFNNDPLLNSTKFVYHTSITDYSECNAYGVNVMGWNDIIRQTAITNNGILFDQADIENWNNTNTGPYIDANNLRLRDRSYDAGVLPDTFNSPQDHANDLLDIRKAKALWVLLAKLEGWDGTLDCSSVASCSTSQGMVLHLDMNNRYTDLSSPQKTVTWSVPRYVPGPKYSIDTSDMAASTENGYMSVNAHSDLGGMKGLTVALWAKKYTNDSYEWMLELPSSYYIELNYYGYANVGVFNSSMQNPELQLAEYQNVIKYFIGKDTNWHHYALTYNGSEYRLYIDGAFAAVQDCFSRNCSGSVTNRPDTTIIAGRRPDSYFNGSIDEVRVYNKSLNPAEIFYLYNGSASPQQNTAPIVNAGIDQTITLPSSATLNGIASDDGLPSPPSALTYRWSYVSGPGALTIGNTSALSTTVSFTNNGTYLLRLTANDSLLATSDDIQVIVNPAVEGGNTAPNASAGSDQTITLPNKAVLNGIASDDGLPSGILTTTWSKVSGPGNVVFDNVNSVITNTTFDSSGTYVLRLTANDSLLATSDDIQVIVNPASGGGGGSSSGAVAYWSFDDASGTIASDSSGNGNNGTLINGPVWTAGKFGGALTLDGINDYVNVGNPASLRIVGNLSICGWVYPKRGGFIMAKSNGGNRDYGIYYSSSNNLQFAYSNLFINSLPLTVPLNTWTHFCVVANGQNVSFTINNASVVKSNAIIVNNNRTLVFGKDGSSDNYRFNGTLDEIRIFNRALTPAEISDLYLFNTIVTNAINTVPSVNAGIDQTINLPAKAALNATASDDGLPNPPGALTYLWSQISGPGTATFANASSLTTTASFSQSGTYILRLTANDSILASSDDIQIIVNPANLAPNVNAGIDQTITLPSSASLSGTASDDGVPNPPGALTYLWTFVSGPGTTTFSNANALSTTASFNFAGTYVLRLNASDGQLSSIDDIQIIVTPEIVLNSVPIVNAGPDQTITLAVPNSVNLDGTASDDGLPSPPATLTFQWTTVSGPGIVVYTGGATALSTTASFSTNGTYVLRLTASDGQLSSSDDIQVTVNPLPCTLISASWDNPLDRVEGSSVSLFVSGDSCNGQQINFTVWEDDIFGDGLDDPALINPSPAVFSSGVATASWIAEWQYDGLFGGDPEYYFIATLASNSSNSIRSSSAAELSVSKINIAPSVNAGIDQTITLPANASLSGNASDANGDPLVYLWSQLSGPGTLTFTNASALLTSASFSTNGTYVLRLTANDSLLATSDDIQVIVNNVTGIPIGAVAYWSFNDGSGTIAVDSSGNTNTGNLTNGPVWTTAGKFGGALNFDGVNDYVNVGNPSSLQINGNISICGWMYPTNKGKFILSKTAGITRDYGVYLTSSNYLEVAYGSTYLDSRPSTISLSAWHHFCVVVNSTNTTFYIDKTPIVKQKITITNTNKTLAIGRDGANSGYYFNGTLDEIRIYGRAISQSEVNQVYDNLI